MVNRWWCPSRHCMVSNPLANSFVESNTPSLSPPGPSPPLRTRVIRKKAGAAGADRSNW